MRASYSTPPQPPATPAVSLHPSVYPNFWGVTSPFIIHGMPSHFHEPFVRHDVIMTVSHLRKTSLAVAVVGSSMVSMALPVFAPTATASPTLSVTAKATLSDGAGPDVQVRVNGVDQGRFTVNSTDYTVYKIPLTADLKSTDSVDLFFGNDAMNQTGDRNLWVRSISGGNGVDLSINNAIVDAGNTWETATDGANTSTTTGAVWSNAAIRWNVPTTPAASSDKKPDAATGTPYLPTSTAAYWAYQKETDSNKKRAFYNIGYTPSVAWYDGVSSDADARLKKMLDRAKAANQVAQIALYGIPHRDCGSLSSGGHETPENYRAWIDRVSAMVGDQTVMVIVEPDAISYCGKAEIRKERAPLLTYVGQKFQANNPNAALYIHAGSGQLNQESAADAVIDGGIKYMRGFAMNVSSSGTTPVEEAWAEQFVKTLEAKGVAGKHYVVDTSRNGVALEPNSNPGGKFLTCNNWTAAVGTRPTSNTTGAHADAYVWAKPVGESDGVCHPGDPGAGKFFPDLALRVVENGVKAGTIEYWEVP